MKPKYAEVVPKTEQGKLKLSYHGSKWLVRGVEEKLKLTNQIGPFWVLRSRDGTKIIFVKKSEDPNFTVRIL